MLITIYAHSLKGGMGRVRSRLVKEIAKLGIEIDLLLSNFEGNFVEEMRPYVNCYSVPSTHPFWGKFALAVYLTRRKPDIILCDRLRTNILALQASALTHSKSKVFVGIHITHSEILKHKSAKKRSSTIQKFRKFYPKNAGIIAVSQGVAKDFQKLLGFQPDNLVNIYDPIVTDEMYQQAEQDSGHPWLDKKNKTILLSAVNLHKSKGHAMLLDAFALVRQQRDDVRLIIAGEGAEKPHLEQKITVLGLEDDVDLPGWVTNVYSYMRRADLFVVSSLTEGLSNALAEAMALGTPVVSTDCKYGPRELLEDGRLGLLTPVEDSQAMAEAILKTLKQPLLSGPLLQKAMQKYSAAAISRQYLDFMQEKTFHTNHI